MKKIICIALITTASFIALFFIMAIALYIPPIQNFAIQKATEYTSRKTGINLRIERIRLAFPIDLVIMGPFAMQKGDTIIDGRNIRANVALLPLLRQKIEINGFAINKCKVNTLGLISNTQIKGNVGALDIESRGIDLKDSKIVVNSLSLKDSRMNILLCDTAAEDTTASEKAIWKIKVDKADIENSSVKLRMPGDSMRIAAILGKLELRNGLCDLYNESYGVSSLILRNCHASYDLPYAAYEKGFDVNHIHISDLNADLKNTLFHSGAISTDIGMLSMKEKCGFNIDRLTGKLFVDSTKFTLSEFELKTPYSTFEASVSIDWKALKADGNGIAELKLDGTLDHRDLTPVIPGGLPSGIMKALPRHPLCISTDISGTHGALKIKDTRLWSKNAFNFNVNGDLYNITAPQRKGNLKYALNIRNIDFLQTFLGENIDIPHGTNARGRITFNTDEYSTASTINAGKGRIIVNGKYNIARKSYFAKIESRQFPLGKILKGSSMHDLSAQLDIRGRNFDPFTKSTYLDTHGKISEFGIDKYDLSNMDIHAMLKKGTGSLVFKSENGFIEGKGTITAQFDKRKGISATTNAILDKLDMRKFNGKPDTMFIATKMSADIKANSSFTTYSIKTQFDSIRLNTYNKSYPAKNLYVTFENKKDSLEASLSAGDLDMYLAAKGNLDQVITEINDLIAIPTLQTDKKDFDHDDMRKHLPDMNLYIKAGKGNPISNMFRYSSGYNFDKLLLHIASNKVDGINGKGYINSFNTGSLLLDSIKLKLFQDTTGINFKGYVHNVSKKNPYKFKAILSGYIDTKESGIRLEYIDKKDQKGMDVGIRANLIDSGVSIHLFPEEPIIAYRNFKLNKENHITLKEDKKLYADIDLLADDGTGMKLYTTDNDSINDITLTVNKINLGELTSTMPYAPNIAGFLSGDVHILKDKDITAAYAININDMSYETAPLGDIGMEGTYMPDSKTNSHNIDAYFSHNGEDMAGISGAYYSINDSLAAGLSLIDFPLGMLNGFMGEMFGLGGSLDGELKLSGSSSKPLLDGSVCMNSVNVYSDIYGFSFKAENDSAQIRNSNLIMKDLRFFSTSQNPLVINGNIDFSDFSRVPLNIRVNAKNFELVDATQTKKSQVYGKVYSNINTNIKGTIDDLHIRGGLTILSKTNVTYVLQDSPLSMDNRLNELVTFTDFSDTTKNEATEIQKGGVDMILNVKISDAARLHCDISSDKQSYIDIEGGGELTFRYTQQGDIILTGRYTVNSGEMKYALPIIPLRTFYLTNGSYIEFTGDPANPTLNIHAKERIKASVTENDVARSVAFDAGVSITKPLSSMGLEFTIEAPDDQTVQNQLASMSKEQRNKLAISMLATGMYLEESNTSSGFKTNNALNAFLQSEVQQIAGSALKTIDLSVNIEDGTTETGQESTDYSFRFAKRFWGNRVNVIIGGKVSTGEDARNDAASFINNVSLEYRLDNSASRYIRLFYDHDKRDPLEGQLTEMGAGIVLRRKTNTFGEIFCIWKRKKDEDDTYFKQFAPQQNPKPSENTGNAQK